MQIQLVGVARVLVYKKRENYLKLIKIMSILYIEDKIKEKKQQQEITSLLSEIGLDPKELSGHYQGMLQDLIQRNLVNKQDTLIQYQEWVKKSFFQEYEMNNHEIITPKFGDKK